MRSDILSENRYSAKNPQEMFNMQNISFSNGFFGYGKTQNFFSPNMWLEGMSIVLTTYKNGERTWGWGRWDAGKTYEQFINEWRYQMNQIIIDMFPVTKEAVLVDKHFGREIDKPIFKLLIDGKQAELLKEAQRLEEESKVKK